MEDLNLEEMRSQIAILKDKLNQQEIVSDRLLRASMKSKASVIRNQAIKSVVCGVVCIILYPMLKESMNVSWYFVGATIVMMLFCIGATFYYHYPLMKQDLMTADLNTVATTTSNLKRQYKFWLHIITPCMIIPWLSWYCYEYITNNHIPTPQAYWFCGTMAVAVAIGGSIGYLWHRKVVNACDEIVEQLKPEDATVQD